MKRLKKCWKQAKIPLAKPIFLAHNLLPMTMSELGPVAAGVVSVCAECPRSRLIGDDVPVEVCLFERNTLRTITEQGLSREERDQRLADDIEAIPPDCPEKEALTTILTANTQS